MAPDNEHGPDDHLKLGWVPLLLLVVAALVVAAYIAFGLGLTPRGRQLRRPAAIFWGREETA